MVVQKYKDMLQGKSVIRQLSEFAVLTRCSNLPLKSPHSGGTLIPANCSASPRYSVCPIVTGQIGDPAVVGVRDGQGRRDRV